jgi:hypothetical protein
MRNTQAIISVAAAFLLSAHPVLAQNSITVPMEVERVSNPALDIESPGSVTLFRVSPRYEREWTEERRRSVLALGASIERSSNTDLVSNRNNPSIDYLLEFGGERSLFGLQASLVEESARSTEFEEFGRVSVDSTQRTASIAARWRQEVTATNRLEVEGVHRQVRYDTPLLEAYREDLLFGLVDFQRSADTRYFLESRVARLDPDGESASQNRYDLGAGWEAAVAAGVTFRGSIGASRITGAGSGTEPFGRVGVAYEGERLSLDFRLDKTVEASGTEGRYVRLESFGTTASYQFTEASVLSIGASKARSRSETRDSGSSVFIRFRSELSQFWAMTLGAEHRRAQSLGLPSARGNSVTLGLVYMHPDF